MIEPEIEILPYLRLDDTGIPIQVKPFNLLHEVEIMAYGFGYLLCHKTGGNLHWEKQNQLQLLDLAYLI